MLDKKDLLESIQHLPSKFSREEIIGRIILLDKIQIGLEQSKAGKIRSLKDVENDLKKGLK